MTMAVRAVAIALAGWLAWGALACSRRGEPVATLIETQGRVERSDAEAWTATRPGFVFVVGDALRTEAASQARLRLTNGTVIRVLENARVRFARGALSTARGADLKVELGSAEVEAATEEMALVTSLGVARVERGARVRVSSTAEPSVDEKSSRGQNTRADVTLAAGDSGTLHVAGRSLALRLTFDRMCDGEASIEIKDGHARRTLTGSEALVLKLHPGAMKYSLRCAGDGRAAKPRATGSLAIKRDSGDAPVSRRAPVNVLDADGRRYTVLFQTRLPALTLKWGAAPAGADNLSLHIESPDGNKEMSSATSSKQLASGALGEGSYVWWYSTADGHTSPKTTVTIRFDNAAPTAQFFSKRSSTETAPKGLVAVDGVTIDGTKVSAGGHALAVDDHGRFRAEVAPLSGDDAVVVRLEHPRTGVHYYVRRLASRHHGRVAHAH